MRRYCLFLGLSVALCLQLAAGASLEDYVKAPDDSYRYELVESHTQGALSVDLIKLHSQTWQDIEWWHWLSIIRPQEVTHPDKVLLLIAGGSNSGRKPNLQGQEAMVMGMIAQRTGAICAVLSQTPNQPLFDGRNEDEIIAYTYDKYLKGEGDDWPLLLPMVKGAVRAMDTIQTVAREKYAQEVESFMLTGASKRGWTSWLTAATDPRVAAVAPIVIDMLNLEEQSKHQLASYGSFSNEIQEYTDLKIQERLNSPEGARLLSVVDPFSYRNTLTLPKLVLLGTNDPYWNVDSANLYYPQLQGEKRLYYQANTGHDVNSNGIGGIAEFFRSMITGEAYPEISWEAAENGALTVRWDREGGKALLWQASSENRDFRDAQWVSSPLEGEQQVTAGVASPETGWVAWYIEVQFPSVFGMPFGVTTQMQVSPETFPHAQVKAAARP